MDRSKVKTLLILLLTVANLFLLGMWVSREMRDDARRRAMDTELRRILLEAGLTVTSALPDTIAEELDVRRSPASEQAAAEALLGPCEEEDMGAGIIRYTSPLGEARFLLGEFQITRLQPLELADPETDILALARDMGLWQEEGGQARLERLEDGYALTVRERTPLWDGDVMFELDAGGRLASVLGSRLLGGDITHRGPDSRSAGWALLSLAWALRAEGAGPSELVNMELGYRVSGLPSPDTVRLTPQWRVTLTDASGETRERYVSAVTGEVP